MSFFKTIKHVREEIKNARTRTKGVPGSQPKLLLAVPVTTEARKKVVPQANHLSKKIGSKKYLFDAKIAISLWRTAIGIKSHVFCCSSVPHARNCGASEILINLFFKKTHFQNHDRVMQNDKKHRKNHFKNNIRSLGCT